MWKTAFKKFEEISVLTLICLKWVPRDTSTTFLLTTFTQKNARKLKFHVFLHFNVRKHMISLFVRISSFDIISGRNSQEIGNFYQFILGSQGLTIGTKFTISCEFSRLQVKWWYHMFSSMKKEECVEFEPSGIFQVKVVTEDIVLGSLGTQRKAAFAIWCLFLKKHTNFLNQTVTLRCFLVKQYISFIYVGRMSFCLVNWAFPFVGFWGPISCRKAAKYFMHMRAKRPYHFKYFKGYLSQILLGQFLSTFFQVYFLTSLPRYKRCYWMLSILKIFSFMPM